MSTESKRFEKNYYENPKSKDEVARQAARNAVRDALRAYPYDTITTMERELAMMAEAQTDFNAKFRATLTNAANWLKELKRFF